MHSSQGPQEIPWGISRLGAPASWSTNHDKRGNRINIGIADTGIDSTHPDLDWNYIGGMTFSSNGGDPGTDKVIGHGTHIAGTIAAVDNGIGVVGVAPDCWLYSLKMADKNGDLAGDEISMIEWAMNNDMHITNHSYGRWDFQGGYNPPTEEAYRQAYQSAGILSVCSAGNEANDPGYEDIARNMSPTDPNKNQMFPSGYATNLEISAINSTDGFPDFTNWGTHTEFAAPGVGIMSTLPGNKYVSWEGTSMSSPHVVEYLAMGLMAYRYDPCSALYRTFGSKPICVRMAARLSADKKGFATRDNTTGYGYGIPNADQLVKNLLDSSQLIVTGAAYISLTNFFLSFLFF